MSKPIIILAVVLGLGGLAYWWMKRQQVMADATGQPNADPCSGGGVFDTIGGFIKSHVDRKNAVAPYVASAYAKISPTQAAPLTNIAGKLDVSAYAENYVGQKVGNALCNLSFPPVSQILSTAGQKIQTATTGGVKFGTEQLKAGTVQPVKDVYAAGQAIARGDVTGAAKAVASSVVDGPKAAYTSTKNFITSLF